jgi:FeS assembly SUF system protein
MNRLARFAEFRLGKRGEGTQVSVSPEGNRREEVAAEHLDPEALREPVIAALRAVYDPEIPVNIYDLGLIYRIDIGPSGDVDIDMTLTAPACPVAGTMPRLVEDAVRQVEGVGEIRVELIWDPPWTKEQMTDEARLQLGLM